MKNVQGRGGSILTAPPESVKPAPADGRLLSILGVVTGVAIAVGGTIGSGIFRTPGVVARHLGDPWLILGLWVFGCVVFLCGALTYAELGSRYPESGGLFVYIRRAYGPAAGFVYGWLFALVIGPAAGAALAVVFGEYTVLLTGASSGWVVPLALGSIFVFAVTNYVGLRWGAGVTTVLTVAKVLGLLALVVAAFLHPAAPAAFEPFRGAERATIGLLAAVALAFRSVIWAFDGFADPLKVGEEIKDGARNVPRSLIGGVLVIGTVYLLVNAAFLWSIPLETMAGSELPAREAAVRLFGGSGAAVIASLAIVSVLGTLNESLLVNPRNAYAMARDGLMFGWMRRVNAGGTPTAALALNAGVALILALSNRFEELLSLVAFSLAIGEVATTGSLFVFRRRFPDAPPVFTVPGYPVVPLLFMLTNLGAAVGILLLEPKDAMGGVIVIGVAAAVYLVWRLAAGRSAYQPEDVGGPS